MSNWNTVVRIAFVPIGLSALLASTAPVFATDFNVSDDASLRNALTSAVSGDTINLTSDITVTGGDLPAIEKDVTLNGNSHVINGANNYRGLFVYSGNVAINNLTINGTVAHGGAGGAGKYGGGGGAGLGGGLFIANGAHVTTSNVQITNDSAVGGAGGAADSTGSSGLVGGGGGLGGNGGGGGPTGNVGGGGGVGSGASGGTGSTNGGVGIVQRTLFPPYPAGESSTAGGIFGGGGGGSNSSAGYGGGGGGVIAAHNGQSNGFGGSGGFGGGGGGGIRIAGSGGFGGGGGGSAEAGQPYAGASGGFGGGGGGAVFIAGQGGFGAGQGGYSDLGAAGGGGAGMGGGIFVQEGGILTLGSGQITGNGVTGGAAGGGSGSASGSAYGSGIFLQGNGTLSLAPAVGTTQTIANTISDQYDASGGASAGSWGLSMDGAGTLNLGAANQLSGGVTVNNGTLNATANGAISGNTTVNNGTLTIGNTTQELGELVTIGGTASLAGGTFDATEFNNQGALSGYGTVNAANGGALTNAGTIAIAPSQTLTFASSNGSTNFSNTLQNDGTIDLGNGTLAAASSVAIDNTSGTISGGGTIRGDFKNSGGIVAVEAGQQLDIQNGFSNGNIVQMDSITGLLKGGDIDNTGAILGAGGINNNISNSGTITSTGGTLALEGVVTNNSDGVLTAAQSSVLRLSHSLSNQGIVSLAGGIVNQSTGTTLTNNGVLSGYGVLAGGSLDNHNVAAFSGGTATVSQDVTNESGATMMLDHATAVFNKAVTNNGTFKTNVATATFNSTFTNNGTLISDPTTLNFTNLNIGINGDIQASADDIYNVSGDFNNYSQQNVTWNTANAALEFSCASSSCSGVAHNLLLAGTDLGANAAGYTNNFAWQSFSVDTGNFLSLVDGNTNTSGGALYVDSILGLQLAGNLVTNIEGVGGLNIYYDPLAAGNAYLNGLTYNLTSGGQLIAVSGLSTTPLPASLPLFASALAGIGLLTWRRRGKGAINSVT